MVWTCCRCCQVASVVSDSVRPHRRQPTRLRRPWDSQGKNTGVGCHLLLQGMKVISESEVAQSFPTLCNPMDCSPPGSSTHGIFQARVLEWVTIAFSYQKQILKRGVKNAGELYKKDLNDPDNCDGVIIHLEPDILEREVKWALGSITMNKASGGDGIPAELFQILKDDAVKVLYSVCQQIWKTQQWPQDWKRSVFIPIPKKGNAKECSNYHTILLISHPSKGILKILQARLQQYMNHELPDVQSGFRKGRGTRDQIANILWIIKKAREFQKNIYFYFIDYAKVFVWITRNCGKFFKRWEYQTTWPASWEICMQVKKPQLDPTWNNRLVPNWERSTSRLYIVALLI